MSEIIDISIRSIAISGVAVLLASLWSLPIAFFISSKRRFHIVISITESLSGIPTVLIGLLFYLLLSKSGPLGLLNLLYTPQAIIIGQSILITPLIIATSYGALKTSFESIGELAISLGATDRQVMFTIFRESLNRIVASMMIAFSRALGELGIAIMVGGNISGETRVFSTTIALSVSIGDFSRAMYLGLVLLIIETILIIFIRILKGLEK